MNAKLLKRIILCSAFAILSVGFCIWNTCFTSDFNTTSTVLQAIAATIAFISIGEIAASMSKFPITAYTISTVCCAVLAHIITPWLIIIPKIDLSVMSMGEAAQKCVPSSLASYLTALIITLCAGFFLLHRKEVFKPRES